MTAVTGPIVGVGVGAIGSFVLGVKVAGGWYLAGAVAACSLIGLMVGSGVSATIWLYNTYQIRSAINGKLQEFLALENSLDEHEVLSKVSFAVEEFRCTIKLLKDIANIDYNIEENIRGNDTLVEKYEEVYREFRDDPCFQDLSEEEKNRIAECAARNACKVALENALVYGNLENFEEFLQEGIQVPDGSNSREEIEL